jgi:hypothetical protein
MWAQHNQPPFFTSVLKHKNQSFEMNAKLWSLSSMVFMSQSFSLTHPATGRVIDVLSKSPVDFKRVNRALFMLAACFVGQGVTMLTQVGWCCFHDSQLISKLILTAS